MNTRKVITISKFFLFVLSCLVSYLVYAVDGGGAGIAGDILLVILGFIGAHVVSFILFIILFKKMTRSFDKNHLWFFLLTLLCQASEISFANKGQLK